MNAQQEQSRGRFLGGHYDSTKQMNSFRLKYSQTGDDFLNSKRAFYHKAKIRLMIDMIFSKTVVLTYAQFLDGTLYHLLGQNFENDGFLEAVKLDKTSLPAGLDPLIEIRNNPLMKNLGETTSKLLFANKDFIFSSLDAFRPGLSNEFHTFLNAHNFTLDTRNNEMVTAISDTWDTAESSFLELWLEELTALINGIPPEFIQPWQQEYSSCILRVKDKYNDRYPQVLDYFGSLKSRYPEPEQIKLLDEIISHFDDNEIVPNRSRVFNKIQELQFTEEDQDNIRAKYNDLMNRTMAIQHNCSLCDEGISYKLKEHPDSLIDRLSKKTLDAMAEMEWTDFFKWLRDTQSLRKEVWQADRISMKQKARRVNDEFLSEVNHVSRKSMLASLLNNFLPGITVTALNTIINLIFGAQLFLDEVLMAQLITILVNYGYNRSTMRQYEQRIRDAVMLTRLVTEGLYGGGSNPRIDTSRGLAYSYDNLGAPIPQHHPLAMLAAELPSDDVYGFNSIFMGDPHAQ